MLLHPDASYYQPVIINYLHAQNSEHQLVKKTKHKTPILERCVTPTMDDSARAPDLAKHPRAKREQDLNLSHPSYYTCISREWMKREENRSEIHKDW